MLDIASYYNTSFNFFIVARIIKTNSESLYFCSLEQELTWQDNVYKPGLDFNNFANMTLSSESGSFYALKILTDNIIENFFGSSIEIGFGSLEKMDMIYSFFIGNIVTVTKNTNITEIQIAPIAYNLKKGIGSFFSNICRAEFGDSQCKVDISNLTFNGKITGTKGRTLYGDHDIKPSGYFVNGVIKFDNGLSFRIIDDSNGILIAIMPDYKIIPGSQYSITAGCNKSVESCKKFNNIINFRGEPFVNN